MQNDERAKIFLPFDALNVYDSIKDVETNFKSNSFLEKIKKLKIGSKVFIRYYDEFTCKEISGILKGIDIKRKVMFIEDSKIFIDDIILVK